MTPSGVANVPQTSGPLGPAMDDSLPGTKLGDYIVEEAVGWGGMGIVYRAVHPLIGRKVAVKVLRPEVASDPEQAERFLKEAQALSAVKHRGIIDIISFGRIPDGRQYMVMEFLEGESLEAVLEREGAMAPARALPLIDEMLDALSAAHKVGVVHRDLKPANVYISLQSNGSRTVKLVDFGLARKAALTDLHRFTGKASLMAGTPQYVSPEQARGMTATPRTDLYCFGVMLFEMLTGELPFNAPNVIELLQMHLQTPPPKLSSRVNGVPPALEELVDQLLQKQAEKRPPSAEVVRTAMQRIARQLREQQTVVTELPRGAMAPVGAGEKTALVDDASRTQTNPVVEGRTGSLPSLPAETDRELRKGNKKILPLAIGAAVLLLGAVFLLGRSGRSNEPVTATVIDDTPAVPQPAPVALPPQPALSPAAKIDPPVAAKPEPEPAELELPGLAKRPIVLKPRPRPEEKALPVPEACMGTEKERRGNLYRVLGRWQQDLFAKDDKQRADAMNPLLASVAKVKTEQECARLMLEAKKYSTK